VARIDIAQLGGILTSLEQESDVAAKDDERSTNLGAVIYKAAMINFLWYLRMYLNLKM
jgi:hypothetical protein